MIHKIGNNETSRSLIIFSLPVLFLSLLGSNGANLGTGSVINALLWFGISLIMLLSVKFYFSVFGNVNIIDSSKKALGSLLSYVVAFVFFGLIFLVMSQMLSLLSEQIQLLTNASLPKNSTLWLICLAFGICSWFGVEAVTRLGYVVLAASIAIMVLLVLILSGGINPDNLYPLVGTSFNSTLTDFSCVGLYCSIAPLLVLCDGLKEGRAAFGVALKTITTVYVIALVFFVLYAITVPHSLGKVFNASLEALFASSSSGEVLHRFEIFLVSLLIFVSVTALSVGTTACAFILARTTGISDTKPFILVLSPLVGYAGQFLEGVFEPLCAALSIVSLFVPLAVGLVQKIRCRS
ncbi:MAG: hypothetical protein E7395_08380 [Ruminococcaceae bacterium]|nr:hypothetical protein [Oscillospiraceae bacterium]